jgi:hypothetical protein
MPFAPSFSNASPAAPPPSPGAPASPAPFSLTPARDDTALFQDARVCFSHLLPGRPVLGFAPVRPDEPPADAVLHLQDAPITIRYRLEQAPPLPPAEVARTSAVRYAAWRLGSAPPPAIDFANATWLSAWSVDAAAVASYDVPGGAHEELFVLVKRGVALYVSWTYPAGFATDPAYAAFASVAEATMVWDGARWDRRAGRVWPESAFFGVGLHGAPRPKHHEAAKRLRFAPIGRDERAAMLAVLSGVVASAGAPWVVLAPEVRDAHQRAMLAAARDASLRAFIQAAFADVRTAHDLRGLAVLAGRALDGSLPTSSIPPPLVGPAPLALPRPPKTLA